MKTLSLVIPVYNEEKRLKKTFSSLLKGGFSRGIKLHEVIFVNDGSTDTTGRLIREHKEKLSKALSARVRLISYKQNQGKGHAVKQGMLLSTADYTLLFDCDMSTPLTEIRKFTPYMEKNMPVIIGTRKNGKSTVVIAQPLHRQLLGKAFTLLSNIALGMWVTDFTCGFKVFSKDAKDEIFQRSKIQRWGYDAEILFLASQLSYPIKEVAVKWSDDKRTKVNLAHDIISSLFELYAIRENEYSGEYVFAKEMKTGLVRRFRFAK